MAEPRRHHYVPLSYLAGFTRSGDADDFLHVFPVDGGERRQRPREVCHERDFYRIDDVEGVEPTAFEEAFSRIEGDAVPLITEIVATRRIPQGKGYDILMTYIALMAARGPASRETHSKPTRMVGEMLAQHMVSSPEEYERQVKAAREAGYVSTDEDVSYEKMKEFVEGKHLKVEDTRAVQLETLFSVQNAILQPLAHRHWSIWVAAAGEHFVTCDTPVVLDWTERGKRDPELVPGFGTRESDVYFPLHRTLALLGKFEGPARYAEARRGYIAEGNGRVALSARRYVLGPEPDYFWRITRGIDSINSAATYAAMRAQRAEYDKASAAKVDRLIGRRLAREMGLPVALPVPARATPEQPDFSAVAAEPSAFPGADLGRLAPAGRGLRQHKENEDKGSDED